ncbi:MAG: response regulator, partial [Nitrospinae bacterium]|nr:response regulator [Nitrospinota bacterium]
RALRSNNDTKHLKIIALTAHAMKGDKEMFLDEGFDGYIAKPIKIKEFIEEIKGYLK